MRSEQDFSQGFNQNFKELNEEDFLKWDQEMRKRLIERLENHVNEVIASIDKEADPNYLEDTREQASSIGFSPHIILDFKDDREKLKSETIERYEKQIQALKNNESAIKGQLASDMFARLFSEMVRDGIVTFGDDMENYFKFKEKFFQK